MSINLVDVTFCALLGMTFIVQSPAIIITLKRRITKTMECIYLELILIVFNFSNIVITSSPNVVFGDLYAQLQDIFDSNL